MWDFARWFIEFAFSGFWHFLGCILILALLVAAIVGFRPFNINKFNKQ